MPGNYSDCFKNNRIQDDDFHRLLMEVEPRPRPLGSSSQCGATFVNGRIRNSTISSFGERSHQHGPSLSPTSEPPTPGASETMNETLLSIENPTAEPTRNNGTGVHELGLPGVHLLRQVQVAMGPMAKELRSARPSYQIMPINFGKPTTPRFHQPFNNASINLSINRHRQLPQLRKGPRNCSRQNATLSAPTTPGRPLKLVTSQANKVPINRQSSRSTLGNLGLAGIATFQVKNNPQMTTQIGGLPSQQPTQLGRHR